MIGDFMYVHTIKDQEYGECPKCGKRSYFFVDVTYPSLPGMYCSECGYWGGIAEFRARETPICTCGRIMFGSIVSFKNKELDFHCRECNFHVSEIDRDDYILTNYHPHRGELCGVCDINDFTECSDCSYSYGTMQCIEHNDMCNHSNKPSEVIDKYYCSIITF